MKRKHAELIKQWADDDSLVIEVNHSFSGGWKIEPYPSWNENCEYRIKPTKPSIDWDHVADEYKWLVQNQNGCGWLYAIKPEIFFTDVDKTNGSWVSDCDSDYACATDFKSFKSGTCDWKDSLVQRPEVEND